MENLVCLCNSFIFQDDLSSWWRKVEDAFFSFGIKISTKVENDVRATQLSGEYVVSRARRDTQRLQSGVEALGRYIIVTRITPINHNGSYTRPLLSLPSTVQQIGEVVGRDDDGAAARQVWGMMKLGVNPLRGDRPALLGSFQATNTKERVELSRARTAPTPDSNPLSVTSAIRAARTLPANLQYDFERRKRRQEGFAKSVPRNSRMLLPESGAGAGTVDSKPGGAGGDRGGVSSLPAAISDTEYAPSMWSLPALSLSWGSGAPEDAWGGGGGGGGRDVLTESSIEFSWALGLAEKTLMEVFSDDREVRLRLKQARRNKEVALAAGVGEEGRLALEAAEKQLSDLQADLQVTQTSLRELRVEVQDLRRAKEAVEALLVGQVPRVTLERGDRAVYASVVEGVRALARTEATAGRDKGYSWAGGADKVQRIRGSKKVLLAAARYVAAVEAVERVLSDEEVWPPRDKLLSTEEASGEGEADGEAPKQRRRVLGRTSDPLFSPGFVLGGGAVRREEAKRTVEGWSPSLAVAVPITPEDEIPERMEMVVQQSGGYATATRVARDARAALVDELWSMEVDETADINTSDVDDFSASFSVVGESETVSTSNSENIIDVEVGASAEKEEASGREVRWRGGGVVVEVAAESVSTPQSTQEAAALLLLSTLDVVLFLGESLFGAVGPLVLGGGARAFRRASEVLAPRDSGVPRLKSLRGAGRRTSKVTLLWREDLGDFVSETDKDWVLLQPFDR